MVGHMQVQAAIWPSLLGASTKQLNAKSWPGTPQHAGAHLNKVVLLPRLRRRLLRGKAQLLRPGTLSSITI